MYQCGQPLSYDQKEVRVADGNHQLFNLQLHSACKRFEYLKHPKTPSYEFIRCHNNARLRFVYFLKLFHMILNASMFMESLIDTRH